MERRVVVSATRKKTAGRLTVGRPPIHLFPSTGWMTRLSIGDPLFFVCICVCLCVCVSASVCVSEIKNDETGTARSRGLSIAGDAIDRSDIGMGGRWGREEASHQLMQQVDEAHSTAFVSYRIEESLEQLGNKKKLETKNNRDPNRDGTPKTKTQNKTENERSAEKKTTWQTSRRSVCRPITERDGSSAKNFNRRCRS